MHAVCIIQYDKTSDMLCRQCFPGRMNRIESLYHLQDYAAKQGRESSQL